MPKYACVDVYGKVINLVVADTPEIASKTAKNSTIVDITDVKDVPFGFATYINNEWILTEEAQEELAKLQGDTNATV